MNKRGFTLIELLAVIVILAIIALIVTPIVLNIIKDSRESAGLRSAEMYLKGVETSVATATINNKKIADGTYPITPAGDICLGELTNNKCDKDNTLEVEMNGEKPESGSITIVDGKITDIELEYSNDKIIVKKDGKLVYKDNKTLVEVIIEDAKTKEYLYSETPNFAIVTKDGEYGLYNAEDDYGKSYYFRGDVENNYVQLGEYTEQITNYYIESYGIWYNTLDECVSQIELGAPWEEQDCEQKIIVNPNDKMYWRIIRINGNGTIRLIYDGTSAVSNGTEHTGFYLRSAFNPTKVNGEYVLDDKYAGYTYDDGSGNQIDSTIKTAVDEWYKKYIKVTYEKYLADSIFCNDREITSVSGSFEYYSSYDRLEKSKLPILTCKNKNDRYTVDDTINGNGFLSNPIGLITADEVAFAGGNADYLNSDTAIHNYLASMSDSHFWTMTPSQMGNNSSYGVHLWDVPRNGHLHYINWAADSSNIVRPVINLKSNVEFTGTGTIDDPYVIITE